MFLLLFLYLNYLHTRVAYHVIGDVHLRFLFGDCVMYVSAREV